MRSGMVVTLIVVPMAVLRVQPTTAFLSKTSLELGLARCNAAYTKSSRLNSCSLRPDHTIALRLPTIQISGDQRASFTRSRELPNGWLYE